MNLEPHPIAKLFPDMGAEEFAALVEDIRRHGVLQPIFVREGKIVDGRHRYEACMQLGIDCPSVELDGSPWLAAQSLNLRRRHLDPGQIAAIRLLAARMFPELAKADERAREEARERQRAGGKKAGRGRPANSSAPPDAKLSERAVDEVAASIGVGSRTIQRAESVGREAPDLLMKVAHGEMKLTEALRQARRRTLKTPVLPKGKYRVIYADPPWKYSSSGPGLDYRYGQAEAHYPAMSIEELCALPVQAIAADDSVLFLWVTSPMLSAPWPVIRAWGFEYKASFVWDKVSHNFGHYNSVRHELLLVCTRGSCLPEAKRLHDSVISIERTREHSEKTTFFRQLIEELYPRGPRVELFGRCSVEGWTVWGNEVAPVLFDGEAELIA